MMCHEFRRISAIRGDNPPTVEQPQEVEVSVVEVEGSLVASVGLLRVSLISSKASGPTIKASGMEL